MPKIYIINNFSKDNDITKEKTIRFNEDQICNMLGENFIKEKDNIPYIKHLLQNFLDFWMINKWNIIIENNIDFEYFERIISKYNESHIYPYKLIKY